MRLVLDDGQNVSAVISRQRAESLGLAPGDAATAYIAATNVLIGTEAVAVTEVRDSPNAPQRRRTR